MFYVLYTGAGRENKAKDWIERNVPAELFSRCFTPLRHMRKKIGGEWMDVYDRLVPGYLFVESENIGAFYKALRHSSLFLRVLERRLEEDEFRFTALRPEDERWLRQVSGLYEAAEGQKTPVMELSDVGFDESDHVVILSGPLVDLQGLVKKIDLHKRTAEVEVEFMKRKMRLHLGIRLLGKVSEEVSAENK